MPPPDQSFVFPVTWPVREFAHLNPDTGRPIAWSCNGQPGRISLRQVWQDGENWLEADHADPEVWFTHDAVDAICRREFLPRTRYIPDPDPHDYRDAVIKIDTRNRGLLIYRLIRYLPDKGCWLARWPD
jgi:hypothetical protein